MKFLGEFKQFIARGNVMDLAIGIVIGTGFQKVISSLVGDIIFPTLSPLFSHTSNWAEWAIGPVLIGNFIKTIVDFIILAFCIFLIVKFVNRFKKKKEEEEKREINRQEELLVEIRDLLKK